MLYSLVVSNSNIRKWMWIKIHEKIFVYYLYVHLYGYLISFICHICNNNIFEFFLPLTVTTITNKTCLTKHIVNFRLITSPGIDTYSFVI